jgi:hypothetical protein
MREEGARAVRQGIPTWVQTMNWAKAWRRYAKWSRLSTGAWDMRKQPKFWEYVLKYQDPAEWIGSEHARWFHWQLCPGGADHCRYPEDRPQFARKCAHCVISKLRRAEELKAQAEDAAARAIAARHESEADLARFQSLLVGRPGVLDGPPSANDLMCVLSDLPREARREERERILARLENWADERRREAYRQAGPNMTAFAMRMESDVGAQMAKALREEDE